MKGFRLSGRRGIMWFALFLQEGAHQYDKGPRGGFRRPKGMALISRDYCSITRRMIFWLSTASSVRWALRISAVSSFSSFFQKMARLPTAI